MKPHSLMMVGAFGLCTLLAPQAAYGQYYGPPATSPFPRPVVSPYLNMTRGGNPAVNYYGVVRPQMQFAGNLAALQQQVLTGQATLGAEAAAVLPNTGHPVRFLNYSHYFFNMGGGTAGSVAQGGSYPFAANPFAATGLAAAVPQGGMMPQGPRPVR